MAPVAWATLLYVAHAEPVDEGHACLDLVDDAGTWPSAGSTTEPFSASTIAFAGTPASLASGVRGEHPVLAVDRHHGARADEREQRSQLLAIAVAGDVDRRDLLMQHLGAGAGQAVDRVVHAQLVARAPASRR